jgi:anti-anti-sigma factor
MNPTRALHQHPPADPTWLRLSMHRNNGQPQIDMAGELDLATAPSLRTAIDQLQRPQQIIPVNLAGLTFCDCAGLEVLIDEHRQLQAAGGALVLLDPPAPIRRLLTLTGLDQHLDIRPTPRPHPGVGIEPDARRSPNPPADVDVTRRQRPVDAGPSPR